MSLEFHCLQMMRGTLNFFFSLHRLIGRHVKKKSVFLLRRQPHISPAKIICFTLVKGAIANPVSREMFDVDHRHYSF